MTHTLEADVALIHIAGGGARITPPPGTLAQTAPRRAARGRRDEMLFVNLCLVPQQATHPGLPDHLARLIAQAYFGTPGSVTYALREAASAFNDHVVDTNKREVEDMQFQGHMMTGVLREGNLYLAQCGIGQAIVVRPGQVTRLTSEEAANRPIGVSLTPHVSYHHLEVNPGDLLILTTSPPPIWSDATLSGLSSLDPAQAVDRLGAASSHDLSGVLVRIVPYGEATTKLEMPAAPRPSPTEVRRATQTTSRVQRKPSVDVTQRALASSSELLNTVKHTFRTWFASATHAVSSLIVRMAPGLTEPSWVRTSPPGLLAITAVAVPLLVVTIAAVVYFGRGKREQFQAYLDQASAAIQVAQTKSNPEDARSDWDTALHALDLAAAYDQNQEADDLRQVTQDALDALDLIVRLDFHTVVGGGFGPEAHITALAASATDLYVLDAAHQIVRRAWGTPERGYEIDKTFECLSGPDSFPEMGVPVDIVIQAQPGALGVEGMVAVDQDGTLLYCAPDRQPALAQLTPPDVGWGRIQAIDVFDESLYVIDTENNAIYIYDATGGLFSGNPSLYFVEEVPKLSGAIDLAMAQDELFILHADGRLDRCRRKHEPTSATTFRIRVECDDDLRFQDERPGYEATTHIPGAIPVEMAYSAPPEPSIFFLDSFNNSVFHYSMRLIYQGQYMSLQPFDEEISALTLGPPNDLFIAVGEQVYHSQPSR